MAVNLPQDRRDEFEALWKPRWKKSCLLWLMFSFVLLVVSTGIENVRLGIIVGASTFFAGIWLSHYMIQGVVAREIRDRLNK